MTTADALFAQELDNLIAQCKIRIEQQRDAFFEGLGKYGYEEGHNLPE